MSEINFLQALVQLGGHSALRSEHTMQMDLLRYWADELARPRNADPKRLLRHGFKVYSQCDEDGIIQEIFRRIGAQSRTFVEFGVESGIECNSAKLLVEGWRGLWLEGSAANAAQIASHFGAFLDDGRLRALEAFRHRGEYQRPARTGRRHGRYRPVEHRHRLERLLGLEGDRSRAAARRHYRI